MNDRVVLITGATGGIGKAAAMELAKLDFTMVIHGRNAEKTKQVCEELKRVSGNNKIEPLIADLFLMRDVRKLADEFKKKFTRLDILINNAGGIMSKEREMTSEGIEKTLAINLITPFLLTELLLPFLKASPDGRIIHVSSNSHKLNAKPDMSDLQLQVGYNPLRSYGNSKLFLIWISQYLSKQLKTDGVGNVTVNTLHPGAVATSFGVKSNLGPILNNLAKWLRPLLRTPEQGADTLIYLATSDEVKSVSGKYFVNRKQAVVANKYYSDKNEKLVWDYCKQLTKK